MSVLYGLRGYRDKLAILYFLLTVLCWKYWSKAPSVFMSTSYFLLTVLCWTYWPKAPSVRMPVLIIWAAAAIAALLIGVYAIAMILYLALPTYLDHGQPIVANASWLWMHGHDLYPDWTTGDIYGLAYGPIVFL